LWLSSREQWFIPTINFSLNCYKRSSSTSRFGLLWWKWLTALKCNHFRGIHQNVHQCKIRCIPVLKYTWLVYVSSGISLIWGVKVLHFFCTFYRIPHILRGRSRNFWKGFPLVSTALYSLHSDVCWLSKLATEVFQQKVIQNSNLSVIISRGSYFWWISIRKSVVQKWNIRETNSIIYV